MPKIQFARKLISAKQMAVGAVTHQGRKFGLSSSGSREARVQIAFGVANMPTVIYHGLGFAPTGVIPVNVSPAGTIYTDSPLIADSRGIVLYCDTANVIAELIVR